MSSEIVRASIENLDQLAPLFSGYRDFYKQEVDSEAERSYLLERMERDECVIFIALSSGVYEGFVLLYPGFDSVMLSPVWTLHDLYVTPDARQQGTGRSLMNQAEEFCREKGAHRIDLSTAVTNTVAQPLYESLGYERDNEFYSYSLNL
jgi:ribosomal protein S18 acetylase RimI-like enzyme